MALITLRQQIVLVGQALGVNQKDLVLMESNFAATTQVVLVLPVVEPFSSLFSFDVRLKLR